MKHTTRSKPGTHCKKNYKHLAAAFAGAVMMSTALLPGIPMATAHAAVNPNVGASQRTSKTNRLEDHSMLRRLPVNKTAGTVQPKVNVSQVGEPLRPTAHQQVGKSVGTSPDANSKQAGVPQSKASKDQPNNQVKPNPDANKSPVAEATKPDAAKPAPGNNTPPTDVKQVVEATATAYAPGSKDNDQWGNKTYTGTNIRPGVIAVDPSVIPLGSRVYLQYPDGHGTYAIAEDTGGAIKGNRIDVAKSTENEASDFGIQKVKVYVVESPSKA